MKRTIFAVFAVVFSLLAANNAVLDDNILTGYKINTDTENYLEINFNVRDINFTDISTEKGLFTSVTIDDGYLTRNEGLPALPSMHELIAMPYGATPEVEVISYETKVYILKELGINNPVMPAQPSYSKSTNPEDIKFIYNESAYSVSKFNEEPIAQVSKSGTMRGIGVGSVEVNPFRYNPVTGEILVYNNIKVKVNYIYADPRASEIAREEYSPFFESAYSTLINYKQIDTKADLMAYPVTYLILANSGLNGNADLNRLIAWKKQKGFNVIVNYVTAASTITTNDTWIEGQYNTLNPKPSFVLVVGDHDGTYGVLSEVNPPLGSTGSVTRSDLLYGVIGATGSSNRIPSMYVGRMSVRTTAELTAQVDKTLWYEKDQFLVSTPDLNYLTYTLGVAGVDASFSASHGDPQISYGWTYYFNSANGMGNSTTYLSDTSSLSTTDAAVVAYISAGATFYNYTAHGSQTSFGDPTFSISNIDGLSNADEYPLVVGNCCLTGSFGTTECFGEAWLNAPNKGAIGYIGASMSTYWDEDLAMGVGLAAISQVPPPLDTAHPGMYDGGMALGYSSQAAIKHVGLMAVEVLNTTYTSSYWSSYHLFGDPSLMIYFGIPGTMTASHDGVIAPGATSFSVTTTPYAYVALSDQTGVLHGAARANSSGVANLTITAFTVGETGKLVITAQFKQPYYEDVLCTGDTGGTFAINQTSLSYGNVDAGSNSIQTFMITNSHGSEYMLGDITTISGYSVALASKEIVKDAKNVLSYSVAPLGSKTFNLAFEPTAAGTYNGNITVTSTDTGHATNYIAVTGTGIVPEIDLSVAILSATVAPEASVNKTFNIINTGLGTLNYSNSINYTGTKDFKGSGGPDAYGYKWKDSDEVGGPVYNWVDITGLGTAIALSDDGESGSISMGMTFNFYGVDYTTVVIGDNGAMTFTGTDIAATNPSIPNSATSNAVIAPFWDDLNAASASSGDVFYYYDSANAIFIVEYNAIVDYGTANTNTFQVLMYASGKIVFQYKTLNGILNECTVGIENETGTVGSLITYNAAYLKNNLAIQFQATPEWLSLNTTSGSIAGSGSNTITATCNATALEVGVYTADIMIASNDLDESTKTLPVTLTVAYGETGGTFALDHMSLSYGNVGTGSSSVKTFQITNSHGTQYLMGNITTINGYAVAVSAKEDSEPKNVLSYTVSPNSSKIFNLTFAPSSEITYNGNITITSSDPGYPTTNIAVTGTGTVPVFTIPFSQDFNASTSLPISWQNIDNESGGQVWQFGTHTSGLSGTTVNYAYLNSDAYGSGNTQNADLITPTINMSNSVNVTLSFSHYFKSYSGSSGTLSYSINGGTNWTQIQQWTADTANPASFSQVITAAAGQASVKFKWNYTGTWGYYWDVDDISITGTSVSIPSNIISTISGTNLILSWDEDVNATGYDIYYADDPYGTFTLLTNVSTNQYTIAPTATKKFYYVKSKIAK